MRLRLSFWMGQINVMYKQS
ncbi:Protein of unknown function [Bacillus toyonensis]|nr:Protein of unknown function [Bacillus toyonensis]